MRRPTRLALAGAALAAAAALAALAGAPATALAAPAAPSMPAVAWASGPALVATVDAAPLAAPVLGGPALAAPVEPEPPTAPTDPTGEADGTVTVDVNGVNGKPSSSIVIMLLLTVLSVAPALLLLCTSFTKIFVVLSIARNALGLMNVPPNQVLAGLALFLSLFIMGPVLSEVNDQGVQPYLAGDKTQSEAFDAGVAPLREFMLDHTREDEIALFTKVADLPKPADRDAVPLTTLVPAFVLSELRAAFLIGFVIFIPFLIIDMVVAASLMSMGMMMLPPVTVSLPFKLLLFVLVNGWGLIVTALVSSYQ